MMKIVVLAGGLSPERNVSLSTGTVVCQALRGLGHHAALIDMFYGTEGCDGPLEAWFDAPINEAGRKISPVAPDLDEVRASRKLNSPGMFGTGVLELCRMADIVFLALHGACGEDGRVQAAFDLMGIPYTGSGYLGSAIAMDKDLTKRIVAPEGVLTPEWQIVEYGPGEVERLARELKIPCVVKPLNSGSSIGVTIVHDRPALKKALEIGLGFGGRAIVEQYIKGREIQVGVLDDSALPSIEIIPGSGFYSYEDKYQPGAALEICPSRIDPESERRVGEAALAVHRVLGLAVYSRTDFILAEDGKPYFLEINTLPGMTPTSLVPQEAAAVGISYAELCQRIIRSSLNIRRI
jgi:D-alanine-D-alanine ligase